MKVVGFQVLADIDSQGTTAVKGISKRNVELAGPGVVFQANEKGFQPDVMGFTELLESGVQAPEPLGALHLASDLLDALTIFRFHGFPGVSCAGFSSMML